MVRSGWHDEPEFVVVLDTDTPAGDVHEEYRRVLEASGWYEREWPGPRGGFESRPKSLTFCKGEQGPALTVAASDRRHEPTAVILKLEPAHSNSSCAVHRRMVPGFEESVLPELTPPPGTRYLTRGQGASGGEGFHESRVTIEAETSLEAITEHHEAQLEGGGWTRTGGSLDGSLSCSAWETTDIEGRTWIGLFSAQAVPGDTGGPGGKRRYLLHVRSNLVSEEL